MTSKWKMQEYKEVRVYKQNQRISSGLYYIIVLLVFALFTAKTSSFGTTNCSQCLSHCRDMAPDAISVDVCRSCLQYCRFGTDDMFRFFQSHSCLSDAQLQALLDIGTQATPDDATSTQRQCYNFHQQVVESFTNYFLKYHECRYDLEIEKEKASNCLPRSSALQGEREEEEQLDEIIRENRNIFVNEEELEMMRRQSRKTNRSRQQMFRNLETTASEDEEEFDEVCQTTFTWETPARAQRRVSGESVKLLRRRGLVQQFEIGKCNANQPVLGNISERQRCRNVKHAHMAIFELDIEGTFDKNSQRYQGCQQPARTNATKVTCKDWVLLPSRCVYTT